MLWHGARLGHILKTNSTAVSKRQVSEAWNELYRKEAVKSSATTPQVQKKFTRDNIEFIKRYLEETGSAKTFDSIKKKIMGKEFRGKKISDEALINFEREKQERENPTSHPGPLSKKKKDWKDGENFVL